MEPITDDQIVAIANRLLGTTGHVYLVAESVIGRPTTGGEKDSLWPRLKEVGGIRKCEECNEWKQNDDFVDWRDDFCEDCAEQEEIENG